MLLVHYSMIIIKPCFLSLIFTHICHICLDEETVDYPMGVRQSATILFAEDISRKSEKKLKERENCGGETTFPETVLRHSHTSCV